MIRVFLTGASGNVGRTIVRTIQEKDGFRLTGGWCMEAGEDLGTLAGIKPLGIRASGGIAEGLASSRPDLVIDFSSAHLMEDNMRAYLRENLNAVIGTTGLSDEKLEPFREEAADRGLRWAVIPNYGLGVSLVSRFVKEASKYYPYISILDQHHEKMANAPSGTALSLAKAASKAAPGEIASAETCPGVLGATVDGAQVLSQRLPWPGPYSGHEITLGRRDEIIRVSIQAYTSDIYMDGLFLTAEKIASFPPGTFIRDLSEITNA